MESFGIQASEAEERCGEPRRVWINALARQEARSRDAKQMEQNGEFDNKSCRIPLGLCRSKVAWNE